MIVCDDPNPPRAEDTRVWVDARASHAEAVLAELIDARCRISRRASQLDGMGLENAGNDERCDAEVIADALIILQMWRVPRSATILSGLADTREACRRFRAAEASARDNAVLVLVERIRELREAADDAEVLGAHALAEDYRLRARVTISALDVVRYATSPLVWDATSPPTDKR